MQGSTVTCFQGLHPQARCVRKVLRVEGKVVQAFWCSFKDVSVVENDEEEKNNTQCLCVCEQGMLSLFMETGATYYVALPFPVRTHTCTHPRVILLSMSL